MAVTPDRPGPYAPISTIVELIERHRERGLPAPVTKDVLTRAGIAETLVPRVLQSLITLDLIGEDGQPTTVFEGIRRAPQTEYGSRLKEWLDSAYADALHYVDPATATETEIRDAFRNYNPVGQQPRMVSLFTGLYGEAGIGPERQTAPRTTASRAPRAASTSSTKTVTRNARATKEDGAIPDPIAGLLSQLPAKGTGWTQERRESFIKTFGVVLDFCFPIIEPETVTENADADADAA